MKRLIILTSILFIFQYFSSQSYDIRLNNEDITYNTVLDSTKIPNARMHFGVYDGQLYMLNRIKERDTYGKALLYVKSWDLYIISDRTTVQYQTLKQAFPKNGFYRTGKQKVFFGKNAEEYILEGNLLDIKLWFAPGMSENNPLEKYFSEMNLLGNVPKGNVLVATEIMNLEVDAQNLTARNSGIYLPDFRPFFESDKNYEACKKNLPEPLTLDLGKLAIPKELNFSYKITSNISRKNDVVESVIYADDFRNYELQIDRNQSGKSYLIDYKNKFALYGFLDGTAFRFVKVVPLSGNLCNRNRHILLEDSKDFSKIISIDRDTHNHSLSMSVLNKKGVAGFLYEFQEFPAKGFISKAETLDDRLSLNRVQRTVSKENFTIQIVAQNEK